MVSRALFLVALVVSLGGCEPEFSDRSSAVASTRILAVRSDPAESLPNKPASYTALLVDSNGTRADGAIDWAYCTEPRPLAELNDASSQCFVLKADYLIPLGSGLAVSGTVPQNACRQFGPDVPEAKPGEPPGRPADPDATGGYSQPLRLILPEGNGFVLGLGETRLTCGLAGATSENVTKFKSRYRQNQNPELTEVAALHPDPVPLLADGEEGATPFEIGHGEALVLRASWPACPAEPKCGDGICGQTEDPMGCPDDCKEPHGCPGAEPYVYYDPASRTVKDRREGMRVSWFGTAGSFENDRTGVGEDDPPGTSTDNTWTAPDAAGQVHVWAVLRDTRGGVAWKAYTFAVH